MYSRFECPIVKVSQQASIVGDYTSSISLVFDFSNESTLEWRLLTVLLELAMEKTHSKSHKFKKARTGQHTSPHLTHSY